MQNKIKQLYEQNRKINKAHVSLTEYLILSFIYEKRMVKSVEISKYLNITPSAIVGYVNSLQNKYIDIIEDKGDRRIKLIKLNNNGYEYLTSLNEKLGEIFTSV